MKFSPIGFFRKVIKLLSESYISTGFNIAGAGRSNMILHSRIPLLLVILFTMSHTGYAGCIKGNCKNGKGTLVTHDGDKYSGVFKEYKLHGQGSWKSKYGDIYKGEFRNGKSHGKGKLTITNGDYYIGEFVNGKFHGKGKYGFSNGDDYIGQWEYGMMHGQGTYFKKNGTRQEGEFANGKFIAPEKETYIVESRPNPIRESNTFNEANVNTLDNVTKDCTNVSCHDELGIFNYGNGTRYIGEFKNGNPYGVGRCEFANGDIYEGEWKMHAPDGKGILTFSNGRKHAAIWDQGIPKEQLLDDYDYVPKEETSNKFFDETVDVYALVVGVASYQHMPSLKYTDDDAYQLYAFLKSPEGGAIPNENIKVLVDDVATKNNILMSMEQLFSKADANDVVLLYMSGHGLEGSFIPSDFDGYNNQLSYNAINKILGKSEAKHKLCIADACHSGSLMASRGSLYAPSVNNYYNILENLESGGTAMLLSSAASELSLEYSGLRQGVFTHFLMNGLRGSADSNHNKVVTISELYAYMYDAVRDYTQNQQSPILTGSYNREMPVAVIR